MPTIPVIRVANLIFQTNDGEFFMASLAQEAALSDGAFEIGLLNAKMNLWRN